MYSWYNTTMQKTLKFAPHLIPLVLSGKKVSTWRLWDNKNLQVNDEVEFLEYGTKKQFARARLIKVIEKPLGKLTKQDKEGHETFLSTEELYKTYEGYYGKPVNDHTLVKIIWFELLN